MSTQTEISNGGALVFLRGEEDADLAEINSSLLLQDGVGASIPMLGDWSILLRLTAKDRDGMKQFFEERISAVKGVADFEAYCCKETWVASGEKSELKASVCAVLEVDSGSLAGLTARLRAMPEIVEGNVVDCGRRIILFLRGNSSREINDVIGGEIRLLPGVLRVKKFNVMVN